LRRCALVSFPVLLTCAADSFGGCRTGPAGAGWMQKPGLGCSMRIGPDPLLGASGQGSKGVAEGVAGWGSPPRFVYLAHCGQCLSAIGSKERSLRRRVEGAWKRPFRSVSDKHMRRGFWIHFANCENSQRHLFSLTVSGVVLCRTLPCGASKLLSVRAASCSGPQTNPFQAFWPECRNLEAFFLTSLPCTTSSFTLSNSKTVLRP
jgi:hypothetical protein